MIEPSAPARQLPVVARARDVSFGYGPVRVFDGLTLDITEGVTGVEGANGVGKTTFLRLCLGLLPLASGRLEILGTDVSADPYAVRAPGRLRPRSRRSPVRCTGCRRRCADGPAGGCPSAAGP